ncbi:metal ABC transporter permease [Gemmata sp. G18]|uniref:Metal ABC transporter permease n=1 Tax=Gemmata palustris TaxID=2822762 RepID=A0ABS5BMV9_9BACT|nr:metal ABC transporter permease [Gemmata palustris]MBP3955005.1 metal ABC transporter permease [Gemmata palustris]
MPDVWMSDLIRWIADAVGTDLFVVKSVLTLLVMCLLCGLVGAMVVGNRMAFFSDAMAHCAFAGVALGYMSVLLGQGDKETATWLVPLVMVAFGVAVGISMIYVRDRTGLAHDTVIGVFFALALGFGAMLTKMVQKVSNVNLEIFLFGNLVFIPETDLLYLCCVLVLVVCVFLWRYNQLMFASFNPSLARTRRMNVTLNNYIFIVLLALVVNLSIKAVGALLINALLIVPAATAANVSRSLRQMFWLTVAFSLASGGIGYWLSRSMTLSIGPIRDVPFSPSGVIVVVTVGMFFGSMSAVAVWNRFAPIFGGKQFRGFHAHGADDPCGADHPFGQCP